MYPYAVVPSGLAPTRTYIWKVAMRTTPTIIKIAISTTKTHITHNMETLLFATILVRQKIIICFSIFLNVSNSWQVKMWWSERILIYLVKRSPNHRRDLVLSSAFEDLFLCLRHDFKKDASGFTAILRRDRTGVKAISLICKDVLKIWNYFYTGGWLSKVRKGGRGELSTKLVLVSSYATIAIFLQS